MQKGFTIVELLVSIGVFLILFGIGILTFSGMELQGQLDQVSGGIKLSLNKAQSLCLNNLPSGIHFETDYFVLYHGSSYDPVNPQNEISSLPNGISISQINFLQGNVTFDKITGYVTNFIAPANLKIQTTTGKQQILSINKLGVVEIQ